jgi:hypothetical protein
LSWPIIDKNYWKGFVGNLSPTKLIKGKLAEIENDRKCEGFKTQLDNFKYTVHLSPYAIARTWLMLYGEEAEGRLGPGVLGFFGFYRFLGFSREQ